MPLLGTVPGQKDGFRTLVTFANAGEAIGGGIDIADLKMWIKEIMIPGFDGGPKIPQTTMHNLEVETNWHQQLLDVPDMNLVVAYSGFALAQMRFVINKNLRATFSTPTGFLIQVNLYIQKFVPNSNKKGEQPTAQVTLVHTGIDSTLGFESIPTFGGNLAG